jgi:glycerol-3-phosphate acyltransferase PlsX
VNGKRPITVGVDGMGGDSGPGVIVEGALLALRELDHDGRVTLIGDRSVLEAELRRLDPSGSAGDRLVIEHAAESVGMGEDAATAARRKKESSLAVGTRLMKEGRIDALFSAGNTGAMVAASLLGVGRVPGVLRPALATRVPADTPSGFCVMLDVGATANCKPAHLAQFAVMGEIYTRRILGVAEPRVGLLNIGEEPSKGNDLTREAHELMVGLPIRFAGNVEGRDIFRGQADVVVTDGFTGNVVLKVLESVPGWIQKLLTEQVMKGPLTQLGALLMRPAFRRFKRRLDYAEYGGAPLLGVNGACIVGHGRSSPKAVKNGLKAGAAFVSENVNDRIQDVLGKEGVVPVA